MQMILAVNRITYTDTNYHNLQDNLNAVYYWSQRWQLRDWLLNALLMPGAITQTYAFDDSVSMTV